MSVTLKIAFIEYDPKLFEIIDLALQKMGRFDVHGFDDALAAVAFARKAQPDALFIDCANVGGQTAAVLKAMRADPDCRSIPIILASDRKRIHQIRRYKAIGATTVIPTPINPFSLTQTIRAVLAESALHDAQARQALRPKSGIIEHAGLGR